MMKKYILLILLACSLFFSCSDNGNLRQHELDISYQIPTYKPKIHNYFPHDATAFTQGLFYKDGFLYESTGLKDKSSLRKVDIKTGKVLQKIDLASYYFAEGITLCNDKIVLLTWQNKKGFIYDKNTFQLIDKFSYQTEGWGITFDGSYLIMSDGTDVLYYLNPENYNLVKKINVSAAGKAVKNLNELEYINGRIYANIWKTKQIAIIQPDGNVTGWIDLTGIISDEECPGKIDELNGIAYNEDEGSIYVTGKLWCKLFELEIIP
jgi:glutaminyl-peptide cyclotransferase